MTSPVIREIIQVDSIDLFPGETITINARLHGYDGTEKQFEGSAQIEVRVLKDGTIEVWITPDKVQIKDWTSDTWQPQEALK